MTEKENFIRNVKMQKPQFTPAFVAVNKATILMYGKELKSIFDRYPELFGGNAFTYEEEGRKDLFIENHTKQVDAFGCTWEYAYDGVEGFVTGHPLDSWDNWDNFMQNQMPDPDTYNGPYSIDFDEVKRNFDNTPADKIKMGSLVHGFMLLRAQYLRGFENLMYDIGTKDPRLDKLFKVLEVYSTKLTQNFIDMGVEVMGFPEDLGTQDRLIMGPPHFRKYIKPIYNNLVNMCKPKDILTHIHSDGYILEIAEDLLSCGFNIINVQDLCNGIDDLAKAFKGKICIDLDIDRQSIVPFGTPQEIDNLIEHEVGTLGSKNGGLSFIIGIYPPTPPKNIEAVCKALMKYKDYWLK